MQFRARLVLVVVCTLVASPVWTQTDANATLEAAENGDMEAQIFLGMRYQAGVGVRQNHAEAIRWYRVAADQGDADAQYLLGVMYHNGWGISKDHVEAAHWYRLAAEQGHIFGQASLAVMYNNGEGV